MDEPKTMEKALASFDALYDASSRVHEGDFVFNRITFHWIRKRDRNLYYRELQTVCNDDPIYREETSPSYNMIEELNGMIHMIATNPFDRSGIELAFCGPPEVMLTFKSDKGMERDSLGNTVPFFRDVGYWRLADNAKDIQLSKGFGGVGSVFVLFPQEKIDEAARIIMSTFAKMLLVHRNDMLDSIEVDYLMDFRIEHDIYDPEKHELMEGYADMFCNVNF